MRPVTVEHIVSQYFAQMPTAGVAPSWTPNTVGWYVRLYGNYQPHGHAGMDFACPIGTRVHAMADGVVLYAGWGYNLPGTGDVRKWLLYKNFPGIVSVIQHPGWIGVYAHLSDNDMAPAGTRVKMGQLIALSGNTGGVAEHLHVEALVDLSYRTGGGLIYGRTDPSKYFHTGSAAIAPQSTPTVQEDDMPLTAADHKAIALEVWAFKNAELDQRDMRQILADTAHTVGEMPLKVWSYVNPGLGGGDAYQILRDAVANTDRLAADVAKVAAQSASTGATEEQIKDAVKAAISESIVTVDVNVAGK